MAADPPDNAMIPPRAPRVAFRSRPAASSPATLAAAPAGLVWSQEAAVHGTDRDILMGYQLFLGRDPENSFVIAEAKSSPLRGFINGLILSGEFETAVLQPLARRTALPHERGGAGPAPEQTAWLTSMITVPQDLVARLAAPTIDWRGFWAALTAMPGFPRGAEAAVPAALPQAAATGGFILVTIEQPKSGDKLLPGTTIVGSGWAIAPEDIAEITVMLDGVKLGQARHGLPRADVARNFPHYRHVDHCGFAFSVPVPADAYLTPQSQIGLVVRTVSGQTGRRGVRVAPPVQQAAQLTLPLRLTVEDARIDASGYLRLRGWALSHVASPTVTVFLGDTKLGEAEYGLERPGLATSYSDYPAAGRSGFVFGANVAGRLEGAGSVRVQATDRTGEQRQVIVPVSLPAATASSRAQPSYEDSGTHFQCDEALVAADGRVTVSGWALPPDGVQDLSVLRAGKSIASPIHGSARPDIGRRFPGAPGASRSGFKCSFLPAFPLGLGDTLTLRLRTGDGQTVLLDVPLTEARAEAALPSSAAFALPPTGGIRLMVEVPALEGEVAETAIRGAMVIDGWAVAPSGIATVSVLCEGKPVGDAYLGKRREDLARTFPDLPDALRGGFALVLPPGSVEPGLRQFTVVATSRDGATQAARFTATIEPPDARIPGSAPRATMPRTEEALFRAILAARSCAPVFDIVLRPGAPDAVQATLHSLTRQAYAEFEITADDETRALAAGIGELTARLAPRAKAKKPARAAQASKPRATRLTMVLEAGDVLGCDALLELAVGLAMNPRADFFYADEQRHDPAAGRAAPFHKPDWSPELLRNMDYVGRPWCATDAALSASKLDLAKLLGQPSYASVLALTDTAGAVVHIARVLAATVAVTGSQEAIPALRNRVPGALAEAGAVPGTWRLRRHVAYTGLVSVILPTAGQGGLVKRAVETLRATTQGIRIEIVVLDNVPAADINTKAWLADHADRVLAMPGKFNWSRFNNQAAAAAAGDMLLFLNDDIEAHTPGWLHAMLEHATRPEVAVTGARLLYPDGKVQHGGIFLAENAGRHAFRFASGGDAGPFGMARVAREMSAVTGACQLVRRDVFERLGGFDEAHDVINNDVDFCLRAQQAGYSVIYTPHAELMHHELASRALIEDRYDEARFLSDYRLTMLRGDPYHSSALRDGTDYEEPDLEPVTEIHAGPRGPAAARIRRILAVKLDHIGDFLTALPALRALASRFPTARITLLAPPASARLAAGEACIHDIIEFTFFHARSAEGVRMMNEADTAELATRLAGGAFDMAIDLRMHPETRDFLRVSGAPFLVGYDRNGAFPWLDVSLEWEGDERLRAKPGHIAERLLALVEAAALACRAVEAPVIAPVRPAASIPALARLPADFLAHRLVCIHPGVGNAMRRWPAEHFGALIDLLAETEDLHAILVGGTDEQEYAREVMAATAAQDRVISLAGALTLEELAAIIQASHVFVGNDSGPKHMAAALGVPTLGIHSAVVDAKEWAPMGAAALALERHVACSPCYLAYASECPRGRACLTGLKPRDALAACRRLLALRG